MFSLKNIQIFQKFNFLIAIVVVCFIAIWGVYFVQVSSERDASQKEVFFDENGRLLGEIRTDLMGLNLMLGDRFARKEESTGGGRPGKNQFQLRTSLTQNITTLKTRTQNINILTGLKEIEQQLNSFDSLSQQLIFQNENIGENAKSGLLLELSMVAEQFEAVLLEVGSASIKSLVLDVRRDEQSLLVAPNAEELSVVDEKIYKIVALLSGVQQSEEKLDDRMSVVDEYSKKLSQLVSASEDISVLEVDLVRVGEKLSAGLSGIIVASKEHAGSELKVLNVNSQFFLKLFVAVTVLASVLIVMAIVLMQKIVSSPLGQLLDLFERLNEGELDARVYIPKKDEFGKLAQALNLFLDSSLQSAKEASEKTYIQNTDMDVLAAAVASMAAAKELKPLPVVEGGVGKIAESINNLNRVFFELFSRVKKTSITVDELSARVLKQSVSIGRLASDELKQVLVTSKALRLSTRAMEEISFRTKVVGDASGSACRGLSETKNASLASVQSCELVQQAIFSAKERMEGLLELSQNIQGIVDSMNSVADRSHILALNVSMCSSAPDEGEGSEVEDTKALAQHARQASKEVLSIVENTRNDLFDTINTMNGLVEQVVLGFNGVNDTNTKISKVGDHVRQLEEAVKVISGGSERQVSLMKKVCERSDAVRKYIEVSSKKIQGQQSDANSLKNHSEAFVSLVDAVKFPIDWCEEGLKGECKQETVDVVEELV